MLAGLLNIGMDLSLVTLDDIIEELRKRPLDFAFIVAEHAYHDGTGRLAFSGLRPDGLLLLERAYFFLDEQPDDKQNVY